MSTRKGLRTGYTTGTCAAAAAKAAALALMGKRTSNVSVTLPGGQTPRLVTTDTQVTATQASSSVVKDAGDDPDVTHEARITATVSLRDGPGVLIRAGEGVGTVTRPGLAVPPGRAAINPVPCSMIRTALKEVLPAGRGARVVISVEGGEELAKKTLNPRLGIKGGISILGTTGIVVPYSHDAYRDSIACALDVARASGCTEVVLSTGKSSEQAAKKLLVHLPVAAFVLMGDHFSFSVRHAADGNMQRAVIACYPAKLVKMACGAECTHCRKSEIDMALLRDIAAKEAGCPAAADLLYSAHTVRQAVETMAFKDAMKLCACLAGRAGKRICHETNGRISSGFLVLSYRQQVLYRDT